MDTQKLNKEMVTNAIKDLVSNFIYYDRKEDEDLPLGAIEAMLGKNMFTIQDMVDLFHEELTKAIYI
jgi:hypothetical protein